MKTELELMQESALESAHVPLPSEHISTGRQAAPAGHCSSPDRSPSLQLTRARPDRTRSRARFFIDRWAASDPIGQPTGGYLKCQRQGFTAIHPWKGAARLEQRDRLNRQLGTAAKLAHRQAGSFPGGGDSAAYPGVRFAGGAVAGLRLWRLGVGTLPANFFAERLLPVAAKRQPAGRHAEGCSESFYGVNARHPLPTLYRLGDATAAGEDAKAVVTQAGALASALKPRRQAEPERIFSATSHAA